jgi:transmembrane sensor
MSESTHRLSVDEQAAYWFLRLRDRDVSAEEIEAALDWQEARPEHRAAFARTESLWRLCDGADRPPLSNAVETDTLFEHAHAESTGRQSTAERDGTGWASTPRSMRRRFAGAWPLMAAGVAALAVLVVAAIQWSPDLDSTPELVRYATAIGENRVVKLADGSEVTLSGASAISVDYSDERRHVTLTDGEALFNVAKDAGRPFVVAAASGQVEAIGTQFDVRRGLEGVTVTVVEGIVQVQPAATQRQPRPLVAARLSAGHQVSYSAAGEIGAIARVSATQSVAWRDGKLIFIDKSLADIAVDLNRYSRRPISIEGEDVRAFRFTGVIVVANMDEWLRALEKGLPVRVIEHDGKVSLVGTGQPASL